MLLDGERRDSDDGAGGVQLLGLIAAGQNFEEWAAGRALGEQNPARIDDAEDTNGSDGGGGFGFEVDPTGVYHSSPSTGAALCRGPFRR